MRRVAPRTSLLMALLLLFIPLPGLAGDGSPALSDPGRDGTYAFVNVTVIPMDSERMLPGQTVVVQDGVIVAMGPAESTPVPEGATRIAGEGRYLMPGLAEIHAHVPPGQDPPRELIEETLFLYVANGVTTIRGMLGAPYQLALRDEIARGGVLGPHFIVGAPSVNGNSAPTPEAAEALVRAHAEAGYDFLKIHPGVPLDAWDRMVEVAREVGITYAGHIPADVGIYHAIRTGMSTIDHLDGYLEATRRDDLAEGASMAEVFAATDAEKLDALVRELAERRVWQVPTQYLWNHLFGYVDADAMLALPEFRYISPSLRMNYRNRAEANVQNPAVTPESDAAHRAMRQEFLRATHAAGVPILMGTDSPQLFNVPGFALHREIPLMEDAGMSRWEVLLSGTRNVAEYVAEELGEEGNFGVVAVGNRADLVLLEGNPLESLRALQDRAGVMVGGWWVSATEINERLAAIARKYAEGG